MYLYNTILSAYPQGRFDKNEKKSKVKKKLKWKKI